MKKLVLTLLVCALLISATACAGTPNEPGDTTAPATGETTAPAGETENPVDEMPLSDIMAKILDGVDNLPESFDIELTADNFESYVFTEYKDGYEALCSEAMINITTHSVVLLRVPEGADAEAVAKDIKNNANPFKWVCVSAEKVIVRQYGNTILLIMSYEQMANQIVSKFDALNGAETPAEDTYTPETTSTEAQN
jgi:hypothetical protein